MQERDVLSNDYFKDKMRFADFLNGYVYHGKTVVQPEHVQEIDSVQSKFWKNGSIIRTNVNILDVKRKVETEFQVVLVLLQNQTHVHYAMPVRVMNEDATDYYNQWKAIQKIHRANNDLRNAEFLSGFSKTDRLTPVISIVIYFGEEPWDGPRTLKDMLDLANCPKDLQKMIADYPINLFEVRNYDQLEHFRTDLQVVFGFLQCTNDKKKLKTYVEEHKSEFSNMAEDACDLICAMSHTTELKTLQMENQNKGGDYNVCKAIDDMKQEAQELGEDRINLLNQKLLKDNRTDDMSRAIMDRDFQRELLKEYGL